MHVPGFPLTDINEGVYYNTKGGQGFVNHARFFKTLSFSVGMFWALTACQVDDVELGTFHLPNTRCRHSLRLNDCRQNRVGATAFFIHLSWTDVSVPGATGDQVEHILHGANRLFN